MAQNITEAIEDVSLIKKVIDKTQTDFSRIANFFIAIGALNAATYLMYAIVFRVIGNMDEVAYSVWMFFRGLNYISIVGYTMLFLVCYHKLKKWNNHLSLSLIKIWGTLLVGGEAFRLFFSTTYFGEQDAYFYQKTLAFLFPVIGCFVLGFVIQDRLIQWGTFAVVVLYMLLAGTGVSVSVADFHGNDVKVGLDMLLTAAVVSVGMILLGLDLRRKGER